MKIRIDFNHRRQEAILEPVDIPTNYLNILLRTINDFVPDIFQRNGKIYLPWRCFLIVRKHIVNFAAAHSINIELSDNIKPLLKKSTDQSYSAAQKAEPVSYTKIKENLLKAGFTRDLTNNQLKNISSLGNLPAGATFSVPGAGKTTEALAYFFLNADPSDYLLVVAPKNALGSWEEQLNECLPCLNDTFVRLQGGQKNIEFILSTNPRYMLITYRQYTNVEDLIQEFLMTHSCFMFLDESHKIKNGKNTACANAILKISYLPKRKLIMNGTPMPQSVKDLIPQLQFLYPELTVSENNAADLIHPIYVRTTSDQLGIPKIERRSVPCKMDSLQEQIYETLKSETKRQLIPYLTNASKKSLRDIGNCVIKLIQFVSNPALLAKDLEYTFDPKIRELLLNSNGPKIKYACDRAHELAAEGKKVIIWTNFVENIKLLNTRLSDLGADYIDGSVDTGDEDEFDTREWKIKEFHDNPNKWVLIANPAAASEGISLHKVCQNALYLDRTFNAAQYLQSEDRIHRLGLKPNQIPHEEIIVCENTIDQVIDTRLTAKVQKMSEVLNDPALRVDAIPYDFEFDDNDSDGLDQEDANAILQYFLGGAEL